MRNILIKQFIAAAIFCGIASIAAAQVKVEKCGVKSPTAFAIITDSETLSKCSEEFHAYKQVLEEEGLGTYIISADWKGPEEVKAEILALAGKKPRLEGVVFAGDIPIVKVRQGQHLTTAFKMNEETWPMEESSVPSRFSKRRIRGFLVLPAALTAASILSAVTLWKLTYSITGFLKRGRSISVRISILPE